MLDVKAFADSTALIIKEVTAPLLARIESLEEKLLELPIAIDGKPGCDGLDGINGRGIEDLSVSEDGFISFRMTDETEVKFGPVFGKDGRDGIDGIDGKNGDPGTNGLDGKDGKDGQDGTNGNDGINGEDGTPGEPGRDGGNGTDGINGKDGNDGQDGIDGTNGMDGEDGRDGLNGESGSNGSDGQDGSPGTDGTDGTDGAKGLDGLGIANARLTPAGSLQIEMTDGSVKELGPIIGKDGRDGVDGQNGIDGKKGDNGIGLTDALIDRSGSLIFTMSDGSTKSLGLIIGHDGEPGKDGEKGNDGFSAEDVSCEIMPDGRTILFSLTRGETKNSFALEFPLPIYRGVFKEVVEYSSGDLVTWGGSLWHCDGNTKDKPGTDGWTLAARKGRDGKTVKNETS